MSQSRQLIINNCAFFAEFPAPFPPDMAEIDKQDELCMFARLCIERICRAPMSARIAGCPDTSRQVLIADWSAKFVADFYGVPVDRVLTAFYRHHLATEEYAVEFLEKLKG